MSYSKILVERLQEKTGKPLTVLARELATTQGYLSQVKNGQTKLSDDMALRIGDKLGLNEKEVLINISIDKAKSERARTAWVKLATGTAAAVIMTTTGAIPLIDVIAHNVYYVKSTINK